MKQRYSVGKENENKPAPGSHIANIQVRQLIPINIYCPKLDPTPLVTASELLDPDILPAHGIQPSIFHAVHLQTYKPAIVRFVHFIKC